MLAPDDAHVTRCGAPFHVALPGWRHTVTRPQVRRTLRGDHALPAHAPFEQAHGDGVSIG